jgi:hypothetical protein
MASNVVLRIETFISRAPFLLAGKKKIRLRDLQQ